MSTGPLRALAAATAPCRLQSLGIASSQPVSDAPSTVVSTRSEGMSAAAPLSQGGRISIVIHPDMSNREKSLLITPPYSVVSELASILLRDAKCWRHETSESSIYNGCVDFGG